MLLFAPWTIPFSLFVIGLPLLVAAVVVSAILSPEPVVVEKEVVKEVEIIKPVEVLKGAEIIREIHVPVEKEVEVIRPVEVLKEVEVIREIPIPVEVEVEKEVIKEIKVFDYIEVPVEVEKEVIRTVAPPGRFFVRAKETEDPEEWLLAVGKSRWKTGYSAKSLAYSWEEAQGFPPRVRKALDQSGIEVFADLRFVRGHVEHKVPLPGGSAASQNDIFVLAESEGQLVVVMVEGKVKESFGQYVVDWLDNISPRSGKPARLLYLKETLGLGTLSDERLYNIRYQLLHRTASALIEAERFGATTAVMLVHSFSQEDEHLEDYQKFVKLFGPTGDVDTVSYAGNKNGIDLYLAWVRGNPIYLEK